ncbi:MAG: hypothetical protein QF561_07000 [Phycisphaerales bacterium]|jgi:hypothetical protein|nr:hypothetical protein [Phycisphaerales bacterium]
MIFSTAFALLLGLNLQPQYQTPPPDRLETACVMPTAPSQPVSLAVGDALGRQMVASHCEAVPPVIAARRARVALPAVAWTIMPGESNTQFALTH